MIIKSQEQIRPRSGAAAELKKGEYLKVSDPEGQQVSDLVCFNAHDTREWLSSGKTLDYADTLLITKGHKPAQTEAILCWR